MGGCGLCSKASIAELSVHFPPHKERRAPASSHIQRAFEALSAEQQIFQKTGGVHAAGLWHLGSGRLLAAAEDIGRHNAVDKVIGAFILSRRTFDQTLLVATCRAGFEIVQKAAAAGIPAVATVSAPSEAAILVAKQQNMFLAGFVRHNKMNVYA